MPKQKTTTRKRPVRSARSKRNNSFWQSGFARLTKPFKFKKTILRKKPLPSKPMLAFVAVFCLVGGYALYANIFAAGQPEFASGVPGMCLENKGGKTVNGNPVTIGKCDGWARQQFEVSGTRVMDKNLCMQTRGGGLTNGTRVEMNACNGWARQNWTYSNNRLVGAKSGKCLTATSAGAQLTIQTCNGSAAQRWTATTWNPLPVPTPTPTPVPGGVTPTPTPVSGNLPGYCSTGGAQLWANLHACGWPDATNTGPDTGACPGGVLTANSGSLTRTIVINTPNTVISCQNITGQLDIRATGVTIRNSTVSSSSGKTGTNANGTSSIYVEDGASATVDHVAINGNNGEHACIWHQGTSLNVTAVNCYGVDDGIFSWADTSYSSTTGDHFTIKDSYFHNLTAATANGHEDGYQTEGAANGLIQHNTYQMTTAADSAVAIWDSLKSSHDITVTGNLMTGGGFAIYDEDYSPSESNPVGGFTNTNVTFTNNSFSTQASGCVGQYGVWFARPSWTYQGGPTDGWHRSGNKVLETGEKIDSGNPHSGGALCS